MGDKESGYSHVIRLYRTQEGEFLSVLNQVLSSTYPLHPHSHLIHTTPFRLYTVNGQSIALDYPQTTSVRVKNRCISLAQARHTQAHNFK
jgi:hypothetical protein